jgi:hypothetical protein
MWNRFRRPLASLKPRRKFGHDKRDTMKTSSDEAIAAITKNLVEFMQWSFSVAKDNGFLYPWTVEIIDGEGDTWLSYTLSEHGEVTRKDHMAKEVGYPLMIAITDAAGKSMCTPVKQPNKRQSKS